MRSRPGSSSVADAIRLVARAGSWAFAGVVALFALSGIGLVVQLLLARELLDVLIASGGQARASTSAWPLLLALIVSTAVVAFVTAAGSGMHRLLAERLVQHCGETVLAAANRARLRDFDDPDFHDRIQRANRNGMSPLHIAMAVPELISAIVSCIGISVGLAVISPWLIPLTVLSCVPLFLAGRANSKEMYSFQFGSTPNDRARQRLSDMMFGRETAAEVRAFGLGSFLMSRWSALYAERLDGIAVMVRTFLRRSAVGSLVSTAVLSLVLGLLLWLVAREELGLADAAAACVAVLLLAHQSQRAARGLAETMEHRLYVDEFAALRGWRAAAGAEPARVEPFRRLAVDDVSFRYPAATVDALAGVSFDIRAGEVVAIVGHNGSGKTTLAKLLCGLYAPSSGTVWWDDRRLTDLTDGAGLNEVGVVFQDFARYWFTAADNIAIGDVTRWDDRVRTAEVARTAGAGFIDRLPRQYDTPLAAEVEHGVDLSLGQWQRIAIARVLFRDASFLVLDEPTASLDAEAESELFETIERLRAGRTVVLISHRFSTVRSADRILVMHEGRLVEEGSHHELMALDRKYAHMYRLQSSAYAESG